MKTNYCVSRRRNTGNKNAKVFKTKKGRLLLKSICSVFGNKKQIFSKNEGSGILLSLGIKTLLPKIPGLNILF